MRYIKAIGTVAVLLVTVWIASALAADEGPHDKAIKARQAMMQLRGYSLGILGAMAKGNVDYDAELAADAAANLHAASTMKAGMMWPAGSDSATAENATNRALQAMWDTYPKVVEYNDTNAEATAAMMAVAGDGLDALKGAMGAVGDGCKGCHEDFRAEKK
ncbi:MAG: cytochrome c556 [Granulosicoccus sp.]|jgi:cytochrome c556